MLLSILFSSLMIVLPADTVTYENIYEHPYLKKADSLRSIQDYEAALEAYRAASIKFKQENKVQGEVAAMSMIGSIYTTYKKLDSASFYLKKSIHLLSPSNKDYLLADVYYYLGIMYYYYYEPDSALFYHQQALSIRKNVFGSDSEEAAISYNDIGRIYRFIFLDFYRAEEYYTKALEIREKFSDADHLKDLAITCYHLATTNRLKGDLEKSITYGYQALNIFEEVNASDYYRLSLCYSAIANSLFQSEKFEQLIIPFAKAIEYLHKAPKIRQGDLPVFYTNISAAYIELENSDSAVYYLNKALGLIRKQQPIDSINLAFVYQQFGAAKSKINADSSEYYYQLSLKITEEMYGKNHVNTAENYIDLAKLYNNHRQYDKAITFANHALDILEFEEKTVKTKNLAAAYVSSIPSILSAIKTNRVSAPKLASEDLFQIITATGGFFSFTFDTNLLRVLL